MKQKLFPYNIVFILFVNLFPRFWLSIMLQQDFKLVHYAGEVTYTVQGFMEKNNDLLFRDLRLVMSETTNSITKVCLYLFRFFKDSLNSLTLKLG